MKKSIFILVLFLSFSSNSYSQNEKKEDIREAISYLNLFLNEENWIVKVTGGFTYNSYSKTLTYKSKSIVDDEKKTTTDFSFAFNLDNVINIKENIHIEGSGKGGGSNILTYNIMLKDAVYKSLYIQKKGDIIPDYENKKTNEVWFAIEKKITTQDIEIIKRAIRDIFQNISIETKYF